MIVTESIKYVGVNDFEIDLFEGQYKVPNGMAYNSYVVIGDKVAVMDTVDARFVDEWLSKVDAALEGKAPDYLIVQHIEPDHSSGISAFMERYPSATVVSSDRAFVMMKQFFGSAYEDRRLTVKDGDILSLGNHELCFVGAPMVHWPEVIVTYDSTERVLFSADAFGKFGAIGTDEDWACEARRYYFGIVGKYGVQAKKVIDKAKTLDISVIAPLHGPVLKENLSYYIGLYDIWTSYGVESEGVVIAYTSVYGNTRRAVSLLAEELKALGCPKVVVNDLARCDMAEAVEDAFRYGKLVLATTTYNGEIFPFMREFVNEITERGYRNRSIGIIENGSWAPVAARKLRGALEGCKDIVFVEPTVTIRSALDSDSESKIRALAAELCRI